jgi:hypothetical protein
MKNEEETQVRLLSETWTLFFSGFILPLKCNTKHEEKLMSIVLNSERALQEERDLDMLLAVFAMFLSR